MSTDKTTDFAGAMSEPDRIADRELHDIVAAEFQRLKDDALDVRLEAIEKAILGIIKRSYYSDD
jgi:hypothetical protein